ncbi:hypothetical protein CCUS01_16425 [Colletotrichum cuscutae]|uniref:Uncharacterized protein n=1 Tax=Colletotrichum cuscutae TaxID=1209917 RepID=A0AAI9VC06_9PEZI|nr:hypothetical protein CCUS01_16425 [Colletotrichum cuscutae]
MIQKSALESATCNSVTAGNIGTETILTPREPGHSSSKKAISISERISDWTELWLEHVLVFPHVEFRLTAQSREESPALGEPVQGTLQNPWPTSDLPRTALIRNRVSSVSPLLWKSLSREQCQKELDETSSAMTALESKCTDFYQQVVLDRRKPTMKEWQEMLGMQHDLLRYYKHYILTWQHQSSGRVFDRAESFAFLDRMWTTGIHQPLRLMRIYCPSACDSVFEMANSAYTVMSRGCISRYWYTITTETTPNIGRLYHHIAFTALEGSLERTFYLAKSLCISHSFPDAHEAWRCRLKKLESRLNASPSEVAISGSPAAEISDHELALGVIKDLKIGN